MHDITANRTESRRARPRSTSPAGFGRLTCCSPKSAPLRARVPGGPVAARRGPASGWAAPGGAAPGGAAPGWAAPGGAGRLGGGGGPPPAAPLPDEQAAERGADEQGRDVSNRGNHGLGQPAENLPPHDQDGERDRRS